MIRKLWTIPAAIFAVGMTLALAGCPITADDRAGDGAGDLFGGGPTADVVITVTNIPPTFGGLPTEGRGMTVQVDTNACSPENPGTTWTAEGTVANGRLTVVVRNVPLPLPATSGVRVFSATGDNYPYEYFWASGNQVGRMAMPIGAGVNPYVSWTVIRPPVAPPPPLPTFNIYFAPGAGGTGGTETRQATQGLSFDLISPPGTWNPVNPDYSFLGWDVPGVGRRNPGDPVPFNVSTTITAAWGAPGQVVVTFRSGQPGLFVHTLNTLPNGNLTLPPAGDLWNVPDGLVLLGWDIPGEYDLVLPGDTVWFPHNVTVNAVWDRAVQVRLVSGFSPPDEILWKRQNIAFDVPDAPWPRPGYNFTYNWTLNGASVAVGSSLRVSEDITLVAQWETFPVEIGLWCGVTGQFFFPWDTYSGSDSDPLPDQAYISWPSRYEEEPTHGYHLVGWNIGGTEYYVGSVHEFIGDTTITAVWRRRHTATFVPGVRAGYVTPAYFSTAGVVADAAGVSSHTMPASTDSNVAAWNAVDASWQVRDWNGVAPGNNIFLTENTDIPARWNVRITRSNGQPTPITDTSLFVPQGEYWVVAAALGTVPVLSGHTFGGGWYIDGTFVPVGTSHMITAPTTITARWTPIPTWTLVLQPDFGTEANRVVGVALDEYFELTDPTAGAFAGGGAWTNTGFVFDGWEDVDNANIPISIVGPYSDDTVVRIVRATWVCVCDGLFMIGCSCVTCTCTPAIGTAPTGGNDLWDFDGVTVSGSPNVLYLGDTLGAGLLFFGNRIGNHYGLQLQLTQDVLATEPYHVGVGDGNYYRLTVTGRAVGGTTAQLFASGAPWGSSDQVAVSGTANEVGTFTLTTIETGIQLRTGTSVRGGTIVIRLNEANENFIIDSIELIQVDDYIGSNVLGSALMDHDNSPSP